MALVRVRDKNGNIIDIPALNGESAYNIAVKNGFVGTEQEWLDSLKGEKGDSGTTGATFIPSVSSEGVLSWENDKGLGNPEAINIKGDKGVDGFSPIITVSPEANGNTLSITDASSPTKTVFIPNGTSKVTLHSKYYANDTANGIVESGLGSYDAFIETANPLPNNAVVYDVGIWYESNSLPLKEYRGIELYAKGLISSTGFLEIISSAALDESYYGGYGVARLVDENDGTLLTSIKMYDGCTKGFTVYYMVGDEVVEDK